MAAAIRPFYVGTPRGQLRVWRVGTGSPVVVLPGLITGAAAMAERLANERPAIDAVVIELPGLGGSSGLWPDDFAVMTDTLRAAIGAMGLAEAPVMASDLCRPFATALTDRAILLEAEAARGWAAGPVQPPPSVPLPDGTHLTALFAFLRDRHVLDPAQPSQPRTSGDTLPSATELDTTLVAAAARPGAFAALWAACLQAMAGPSPGAEAAGWEDAICRLRAMPPRTPIMAEPSAPAGVQLGYAETPGGRMHLRRSGPAGHRPVILLHSAPGSAAPLTGLMRALATDRDVIAPDYLGNGESDKPAGPVTIAQLAADVVALADSLGLDRFDLWGTHTGALIALEAGILAGARIGGAILEGPVLIPPALNHDILEHYFPALEPHPWGLHLQQAWSMRRDMFLFWPWYRAERAAARPLGIPDPAFLHDWTIGLLQSGASYHRSYRAAFEYDTPARLPLLPCRSLVCAGAADMLAGCLPIARSMALPRVSVRETPATVWYPRQVPDAVEATVAIYRQFLDEGTIT